MPLQVILASAAVAAGLPFLVWAAAAARQRPAGVSENLGTRKVVDERQLHLQTGAVDRALRPALRMLSKQALRLTPVGWVKSLQRKLDLAGQPRTWTIELVVASKLMLAFLGFLVGVVVLGGGELTPSALLLSILMSLIGYFGPDAVLMGRARERQTAIQNSLPDSLDQVTISVEAGLGFDAALARVAEAGDGPLAEELRHTLQDVQMGVPRSQAFAALADRTEVPELRKFLFAVGQAEKYGLPIAKVLRVQASELRVSRRLRAEERAMKLPVKMVFPLVFCIFPALFVVLLGPAVIRIARVLFAG